MSTSIEFKENCNAGTIAVTALPFFDVEFVGASASAYLGLECFVNNPNFSHLMEVDCSNEPKVDICGGKGGVGNKTSTLAALAVSMAAQGHNVALISTDHAHS